MVGIQKTHLRGKGLVTPRRGTSITHESSAQFARAEAQWKWATSRSFELGSPPNTQRRSKGRLDPDSTDGGRARDSAIYTDAVTADHD